MDHVIVESLKPYCDLASTICEVPFVGVSRLVRDQLHFCSTSGLSPNVLPLRLDFCEEAFQRPEGLHLPDTTLNAQFADCPWVTGPLGIRFYCGFPVYGREGRALGVLCIADQRPRQIEKIQLRALSQLSFEVGRKLEMQDGFSSLRQVVGGLVHEINNPLMILQIHLQRLREATESDRQPDSEASAASVQHSLQKAILMGERIHLLLRSTQSLLASEDESWSQPVRLMDAVNASLPILQESLQRLGVTLHLDVDRDLWVKGDVLMISQILVNLGQNALSAVAHQESAWLEISAKVQGHEVVIRVRDSGSGIPLPLQEKIMQAYFTTRGAEGGTGLGLSLSRGLASKMQGSLKLNPLDVNTCFEVRLQRSGSDRESSSEG